MQADDRIDRELRILALGDSYTAGEGISSTDSWPFQLSERLRHAGLSVAAPCIVAKTGWTTADLIRAMDHSDLAGPFDLACVLIGVNNQYQGRSELEYAREFVQILFRARQLAGEDWGRLIVLSIPDWGLTPFAGGRDRAAIADQIARFNRVNREAADQAGVRYLDVAAISRAVANDTSLVASDGLHFSSKMYQQWADSIVPEALAALASLE